MYYVALLLVSDLDNSRVPLRYHDVKRATKHNLARWRCRHRACDTPETIGESDVVRSLLPDLALSVNRKKNRLSNFDGSLLVGDEPARLLPRVISKCGCCQCHQYQGNTSGSHTSNETELSHRWRQQALLYSQLSSLTPQLSSYNGQRLAAAIG